MDALLAAKAAVQRFIEEASAALGEAEADAQRTLQWLRYDQVAHWQSQVRQRHDAVEMAKAELRRKQLTAIPEGPTAVDERRAVERAKKREDDARARVEHVRRWLIQLEREHTLFKGSAQGLAEAISRDLPAALVRLDRMTASVLAYAAMASGEGTVGVGEAAGRAPGAQTLSGGALDEAIARRFASLRRRSPGRATRAALVAGEPEFVARGGSIGGPPAGVLATLGVAADSPGAESLVAIEADALDGSMVVLERCEPSGPGDSGWFVGSAAPGLGPPTVAGVRYAEFAARRPGLAELMSLPVGYLVVVMGAPGAANEAGSEGGSAGSGGGGPSVEAVLDAEDRVVIGGTGGAGGAGGAGA
ncbi:MAG: hypothetical protein JNK35_01350 [Phycisphaerae bacterium]|nr:hypothetical protein [Phycisphaerae bacterium]